MAQAGQTSAAYMQPRAAIGASQPYRVKAIIVKANGLYNADGFMAGKSDPYVICQVVEKPTKKFQTKVLNNTLEPVWDHLGVINGFVVGETLELNVWDKD